jgi:hypothetical protein
VEEEDELANDWINENVRISTSNDVGGSRVFTVVSLALVDVWSGEETNWQ